MSFESPDLLMMLEQIERRDAGPGRAPMHFTTRDFTADEYDQAWGLWVGENGRFGSLFRCHQWHRATLSINQQPEASGHAYTPLTASLSCEHAPAEGCQCVGGRLIRAWCESCEWLSPIFDARQGEGRAVAAWHDHAWPGWRQLPVIDKPKPIAATDKEQQAWVDHITGLYPQTWIRPGAPIITRRDQANRDVPAGNPWGGFDLAHTTTHA